MEDDNVVEIQGSLVGCELPPCLIPGLLRGSLGMFYLAVYQVGISYLPDAFINSEEYYVRTDASLLTNFY